MPSKTFQTEGFIINKAPYGEAQLKYTCVTPDHNVCHFYKRKSSKAQPDLFSLLDLTLEHSKQGSAFFFKEAKEITSYPNIPKNYLAFDQASKWCRFLINNPEIHSGFEISEQAFHAWNTTDFCPHAISLKAYYKTAKSEGYPVRLWLESISESNCNYARTLLSQPMEQISPQETHSQIVLSLFKWSQKYTDFVII